MTEINLFSLIIISFDCMQPRAVSHRIPLLVTGQVCAIHMSTTIASHFSSKYGCACARNTHHDDIERISRSMHACCICALQYAKPKWNIQIPNWNIELWWSFVRSIRLLSLISLWHLSIKVRQFSIIRNLETKFKPLRWFDSVRTWQSIRRMNWLSRLANSNQYESICWLRFEVTSWEPCWVRWYG